MMQPRQPNASRRPGRRSFTALVLLLAMVAAPAASRAQDAPYTTSLMRLSEILGALHHLRPLCGADEPKLWRDKMNNLLVAENPAPEVRQRMVGRFNDAYRDISDVYKTCTPAAQELITRYLAEGAKISDEIVSRYSATQ